MDAADSGDDATEDVCPSPKHSLTDNQPCESACEWYGENHNGYYWCDVAENDKTYKKGGSDQPWDYCIPNLNQHSKSLLSEGGHCCAYYNNDGTCYVKPYEKDGETRNTDKYTAP